MNTVVRPVVRILGIDPGSRATGYGLIEGRGDRSTHQSHGVLRPPEGPLPSRLLFLFTGLKNLIEELQPDEVAMEQVFARHHPGSALVLGQARGAAMVAVAACGLPLHEYAPTRIKQAVSGSGRADKAQVQKMIGMILGLRPVPPSDAADALACALCHAHSRVWAQKTQTRSGGRA